MRWYCCFSAEYRSILFKFTEEKQQIPSHGEFKENSSMLSREATIPPHGEFKENSSVLSREVTIPPHGEFKENRSVFS
jgi:hypothetical protein